jgi:hypothetical protein
VPNHWTIGAKVTVKGTWTNVTTGDPADPTDARVDIADPTGTITTYTYLGDDLTREATGVYTYDIDTTDLAGRYQYRFWSPSGEAQQAAGMGEFIVDPFPGPRL